MVQGPFLALVLRNEPQGSFRALLAALARWSRPAVFDEVLRRSFVAAVVDDPLLVGMLPIEVPYAQWVAPGDHAADAAESSRVDDRVAIVLSSDRAAVSAAGDKGRFVPEHAESFPQARPVAPFVRERLRVARGLPPTAVASVTDDGLMWCGARCSSELIDTVLGLASCAALQGRAIARALAWAAPCVVDVETAEHFELDDGVEVIVTHDGDLNAAAARVSGDPVLAARLSRAGRARYEATFDVSSIAAGLARELRLLPPRGERVRALVDELGGPIDGRTSRRAAELVTGLP